MAEKKLIKMYHIIGQYSLLVYIRLSFLLSVMFVHMNFDLVITPMTSFTTLYTSSSCNISFIDNTCNFSNDSIRYAYNTRMGITSGSSQNNKPNAQVNVSTLYYHAIRPLVTLSVWFGLTKTKIIAIIHFV